MTEMEILELILLCFISSSDSDTEETHTSVGRPRIEISFHEVELLRSFGFSWTQVS